MTSNKDTVYNVVIDSEEIDEQRTDLTIGIYNEDTGFFDYETMYIQDKDTGNTVHGGVSANSGTEQQNADDE